MPEYVPVRSDEHQDKYWKKPADYAFASKLAMVTLVGSEVGRAALSMPMAFVRQKAGYELMAVLSVIPGKNLFVDSSGQWLGDYIPLLLKAFPFQVVKAGGSDQQVVCVHKNAVVDTPSHDTEPFFSEDGTMSGPVEKVVQSLKKLVAQNRHIRKMAGELAEMGLLSPWELKANINGRETKVENLLRVDEKKLGELDDQQFLELRKSNALALAYTQMLSSNHRDVFRRLLTGGRTESEPLFAGEEDELFRFG